MSIIANREPKVPARVLTRPLDDTAWAAIRAAFEEHSVQRLLHRTTISG